jgi:hypothetical protein
VCNNEIVIRRFLSLSAWPPSVVLPAIGLLLPNAVAFGLETAGLGLPPRGIAILLYVIVALLARHVPAWVSILLYLAAVAFDLLVTLSLFFSIWVTEFATTLRHARELDLAGYPLYAGGIVAILATTALAVALLWRCGRALAGAPVLPTLATGLALTTINLLGGISPHAQYGAAMAAGPGFGSAAAASGFEAVSRAPGGRNMLLVIVESTGAFHDPALQALLAAPLDHPGVAARYEVSRGTAPHCGSTTAGEMRELCGTSAHYTALLGEGLGDCLPARLAAAGYATVGFHGYTAAMFGRRAWWPRLGLQETRFHEDLRSGLARECGRVFAGACDADIPARLRAAAAASDRPVFLYWLTLNTHVPIRFGEGRPRLDCAGGGPHGNAEVCGMTEMWMDVMDGVVALATDPALPPFEILVVGDHAPPLWSRHGRGLFVPGQVSWFRLSPKAE